MRDLIGRTLGRYRIVEKIGEGGMGIVWKAMDTALDRDVASKVLSDRLAREPKALRRFEQEAKAVAALSHPSLQSAVPSRSVSVSAKPQPHAPGAVFNGSFGQPSLQSGVPSESLSVSATPQPHAPGAVFSGSNGQLSVQSGVQGALMVRSKGPPCAEAGQPSKMMK